MNPSRLPNQLPNQLAFPTVRSGRRPLARAAMLACAAVAIAAGCSGDDSADDGDGDGGRSTDPAVVDTVDRSPDLAAGVTIVDFAFDIAASPAAGEAFAIVNDDTAAHTFSDAGGAFSVTVPAGASGSLTVAEPGDYQIICEIHSSMSATLTVK